MRCLPLIILLGLSLGIGELWCKAAEADEADNQDNLTHSLIHRLPDYAPLEQDVFSFLAQSNQSPWEPIARIEEPQFPVKIELVNRSGWSLDYGFTDDPLAVPATLEPNETVVLVLVNPDTLLSLNPSQVDATQDPPSLEFQIAVESSDGVKIEVYRALSNPNLDGDAIGLVINIQESGGIFVY